jgi:hypothetical protein
MEAFGFGGLGFVVLLGMIPLSIKLAQFKRFLGVLTGKALVQVAVLQQQLKLMERFGRGEGLVQAS